MRGNISILASSSPAISKAASDDVQPKFVVDAFRYLDFNSICAAAILGEMVGDVATASLAHNAESDFFEFLGAYDREVKKDRGSSA